MTFKLDTELATALAPMVEATKGVTAPAIGDVATRRESAEPMIAHANAAPGMPDDVIITDHYVVSTEGAQVLLRWYAKVGAPLGPAAVYLHGGGMILGNAENVRRPGGQIRLGQRSVLLVGGLPARARTPVPGSS